MDRRLELQTLLEVILGSDEVHFQQPSNTQMKYPAIIYNIDELSTQHADNAPYLQTWRWEITVIDRDPDSPVHHAISKLPRCSFGRAFRADKLNHFVYNLYF